MPEHMFVDEEYIRLVEAELKELLYKYGIDMRDDYFLRGHVIAGDKKPFPNPEPPLPDELFEVK